MTCFRMMRDAKGTRQKDVAFRIRMMSYKDFCQTIYWHLIAYQVKSNAGWRCSVTGKKGNLEVHHQDYRNVHGFEIFHLDDLMCVCREEHQKIYDQWDAALQEYYASKEEVYSN